MNSFGQRKAAKKLGEAELWDYSMRLLAARGYSESEIRQKLRRRAAATRDANEVVGRLREAGYLNDTRFAESFARSRLENQGHGRFRVLRDLRGRQVADSIARQAVDAVFRDTDEALLIERYLQRKFRGVSLADYLSDPKRLAAAYRRLRNAGFSSSSAIATLKRYADRAEELESMESAEL